MRTISYHDLDLFEECQRKWEELRTKKDVPTPSALVVGGICRRAVECITRAVLGADARPLPDVARAAVLEYTQAFRCSVGEMHDALDIMEQASSPDSAIDWSVRPGWTAAAEVGFTFSRDFFLEPVNLQKHFHGVIQRVSWSDEGVEILDSSTSRVWTAGDDLEADTRAQWYALAGRLLFPAAKVITYRRIMLRHGYDLRVQFAAGDPWEASIKARLVTTLDRIAQTEDRGGREMRVGGWCHPCPIRHHCPARAKLITLGGEFPENLTPTERANLMLAYRAAAQELEEDLRAAVEVHGPIPLGNGTELGSHERKSKAIRVTREAVLERLRGLGMTYQQEQEWFGPRETAMATLTALALKELVPNRGVRGMIENELLAPAKSFAFDVKKVKP